MNKDTKTTSKKLKAIIYCRVTSVSQANMSNAIDLQEARCREYAKNRSYEVEQVFLDKGISGNTLERLSLQKMLSFLEKRKIKEEYIVLIDNISVLARNMALYLKLKAKIHELNAKLESPSFEFDERPETILLENMMLTKSQIEDQILENTKKQSVR